MISLIDAAFSRSRAVVLAFGMILAVGTSAYVSIPKESSPEIQIPIIQITVGLDGISPQDATTSLLKPLEQELSAISGLSTLKSEGYEGGGSFTLEFDAGFDAETAIKDVRQAVDRALPDLPDAATDPVVREINTALFPVMTVILSGVLPERTLGAIAKDLTDRLEAVPGVLEVDVVGKREEIVEIIIDPLAFETYGITLQDVVRAVAANNRIVAAGAIDTGDGRLVMKLPGLITSVQDILDLPVKVDGNATVSFSDVASVRRSFADPGGYARLDAAPSISLEIKKKSGANIIETALGVRAVIEGVKPAWPAGFQATISQDESEQIVDLLGDLENNVIAAIIVVMIVILFFLGVKSSFLVGLSIPGSFLAGIAALWFFGYTMNIIVLFGLILSTGMLVDGAIVVIEYADRRIRKGIAPKEAFREAARRMAWPIIASTATTLSVFLPLLFWQGTVGEFMKFLPITILMTLTASLFMALIFIPVLGGVFSRTSAGTFQAEDMPLDPRNIGGAKGIYISLLEATLDRPRCTMIVLALGLCAIVGGFGKAGGGVEFFPATEPEFAQVKVLSRDNLSIAGRDRLLLEVEERIQGHPHIASVYGRSFAPGGGGGSGEQIGAVQIEFTDWISRPRAEVVMDDLRRDLDTIAGVRISIEQQAGGPASGKPISVEIVGEDTAARGAAIDLLIGQMIALEGIIDIRDTRSLPGFDYQIRIDRAEAARYGADIEQVGQVVRLATTGVTLSSFRPGDTGDSIDIRARFPKASRTLDSIENLRIPTPGGMVAISTFATMEPAPRSGTVLRINGQTVDQLDAGVGIGVLASRKIADIQAFIDKTEWQGVTVRMKGEAEDQAAAMQFLGLAFATAILLMLMILVAQFNSIAQALLVLSAIIFSVAGVLLGLMVTGRPFGIVMGGIGIIALAGIVVNNNIVLIDAYNEKRAQGWLPISAALMTGSERLRPVLLTSITTILGLVPMVLAMSIDIPGREIAFGAPSTLWWVDLSTTIVGGLTFATLITLLVTPAALILIDRKDRMRELHPEKGSVPAD